MADPYLAIAAIASDRYMTDRLNAAATQQAYNENIGLQGDPTAWVATNRYVWASSPSWGEKWKYALDSHPDDPNYQPGRDEAVITDGDILAAVQHFAGAPAAYQAQHEAPQAQREADTQTQANEENAAAGDA